MRLCATQAIDHKHAAVLLRGLAICSANLARIARQQKNAPAPIELVQDFVLDPILGTLAPGPELVQEADLPDCLPVMTPKPTITYTSPTPEKAAFIDALYAKLDAEQAAHAIAHPRTRQLTETRLQVQTYPPANEDFGPKEKIISMPTPTHKPQVPHPGDSPTIARVGM